MKVWTAETLPISPPQKKPKKILSTPRHNTPHFRRNMSLKLFRIDTTVVIFKGKNLRLVCEALHQIQAMLDAW